MNDLRLGVKNLDAMDDRMMDASRGRCRNDLHSDEKNLGVTGDRKMVVKTDANRGRRMNDPHLGVMDDRKMVGNLYPHMSDLRLDVNNLDVMKSHRVDLSIDPEYYDPKMVVMMDGSRGPRMNDPHLGVTGDRNLSAVDVSHDLRMSDLRSVVKSLDAMTDVNHGHRMNGLRSVVKSLDAMMDASHGHRMNGLHLDEKKLDVNLNCHRGIRKCALHAKNCQCHRVDLSIDPQCHALKKNCDRLSRDHLQCDHRMLRHREKNLNLGAKMMNHVMRYQSHRVDLSIDPQCYALTQLRLVRMNYRGNPMKVDQRMGAKDASRMRNYGHLDDPVNGTMIYLQAWLLLFLKLGESDRYSVMFLKYCKVLIIKQIWN